MILSHLKTSDNTEKGKTTKWRHESKFIEKIFSYFEYLENQLHRLDVIWQPIIRHIIVYTLIKILLWGYSVSRKIRLSELEYCVTVTFIMTIHLSILHFMKHASFFDKTLHHKYFSSLQYRFGSLWEQAFPKTKINIERNISDHRWD